MSQDFKPEYEMCSCGHFGGFSPDSHNGHEAHFSKGHGRCTHYGCDCNQFTWVAFCDSEGKFLD